LSLTKRCKGCAAVLPATLEYFDRHGTLATGAPKLAARCKPCQRVRRRETGWHPRDRAAYFRAYRRERAERDPEWAATVAAQRRDRRRGTPVRACDSPHGYVPAAPIRDAVERSGATLAVISDMLGYEASTVGKMLRRELVPTATAVRILDAVGVLPAEVGS
jgi:hypothetical protein